MVTTLTNSLCSLSAHTDDTSMTLRTTEVMAPLSHMAQPVHPKSI